MPLTLITGPANAAKAGAVLERHQAALARDPVLVTPTAADVDHYRRELAAAGLVFGGEVVTFSGLTREIAAAAGLRGRRLGPVARDRVVRAVVAEAPLRRLAASAASPGFAAAVSALFAELQRALVTPQRLIAAVRSWQEAEGGARAAYAAEAAELYAAYRRRLDALGSFDADGFTWAALDALRAAPAGWGARPVSLYGFDDLTRAQLDAVETLARHAQADVVVALPYEPGRAAFAARAATVEALKPLADAHVTVPDRSEHYATAARPALHHLERGLFEPGPPQRRPPNGAVRLLESGGERAEAELVGAEVLELMRAAVDPRDIAVLVRGGARASGVLEDVLAGYGIPVSAPRRWEPLLRTRLGAGVLAAARVALGVGDAADVLRWLRTPGRLASSDAADALEARLRRRELTTAAAARREWEGGADPFGSIDALAAAAQEGPVTFLRALAAEADAIWTAPHAGRGAVLDAAAEADARVARELRAAVSQLEALATADPALLGGCAEALEAVAATEVATSDGAEDGVMIADPLALRARRVRAVFVCGLQDGEFPRRATPDPFFSDADRRALAAAAGLLLPLREESGERERGLFYAAVSRPEEVLFLSWRSSDEEGEPLAPSPFVADVRALFTDELYERRGRRLLADVTWPPRDAPTPAELARALAAATCADDPPPLPPPVTRAVRELLADRGPEPTRALETFAGCGMRWLVEHVLRAGPVEPDPEPMRRGVIAHRVLERTLTLLRERTGSARLAPARLADALEALDAALGELRATAGARPRAALRGLEADLRRVLAAECETGAGWEPRLLEWSFGGESDADPPLALGDGVAATGRVDRVDSDGRAAIVRDYKGRQVTAGARWTQDLRLQAALYALAAEAHLGLEPAGALYHPIGARDVRPRGVVRAGTPGIYVDNDVLDAGALRAVLEEARELAVSAGRAIREGRISACPERCSPKGCRYPGICRAAEPSNGEGSPP